MSASTAITKAGGGFAIAPTNMAELFNFAKLLAESDLVPKDYINKPGNCLVAIQMGGELGLSPMQAIQNIAVINGRPSLWGDAMLAVCLPHLDSFDETDDGATATCVAKRGNRTVTNTFSTEDAKRAGLAEKAGPWKQYPARMRKMRARGFTLRDICADVLRGINSAEESADIPKEVRAEVVSSKPVESKPEPEQKQERKSTPPPAATPYYERKFAGTFPNQAYAGKPMQDAPREILLDYKAWLEIVLNDQSRKRLHKKAGESLLEVELELEADDAAAAQEIATPAADPIIEGLEAEVAKRSAAVDGQSEMAEGWK